MTAIEQNQLRVIVMTLRDPKGNWAWALAELCKLADLNPEEEPPAFLKAHPLPESQALVSVQDHSPAPH